MGYRYCSYCSQAFPVVEVAEVSEACDKLKKILNEVEKGKASIEEAKTVCTRDALHFGNGSSSDMQKRLEDLVTFAQQEVIDKGNTLINEIIAAANFNHDDQIGILKSHEKSCTLNPANMEAVTSSTKIKKEAV